MFRSNRCVSVGNFMKLFYEIQYNLINPPPTYHYDKDKERNTDGISPTPIFFPRNRYSNSPIHIHQLGRRINEVGLEKDDKLLVPGKRNVSPSPDPLPNGMSINKRKRKHPFNLEIPEGGIYYINPDIFGFPQELGRCPDIVYFEKYRYLEVPQ
jgi:hypothetical protein